MSDYTTLMASLAPRAWWRCGDAAGAAQDASGNARHMSTFAGCTYGVGGALAAAESNNAISAAGAGYQRMASSDGNLDFAYNANFTITGWVKWTGQINAGAIVTKFNTGTGYPYDIFTENAVSARLGFRRYDSTVNPIAYSDAVLNDNAWHFFAARKSGGAGGLLELMIDGAVQISNSTDTTTGTTTNAAFVSMLAAQSASWFMTGAVDEIAIFGSALNWGQCAAIYTLGKVGLTPKTLAGRGVFHNDHALRPQRFYW